MHHFRLHAETCLLLVLEHCLDQLSHNCALLRLNFIDLNLEVLVLLSHLVEIDSKLVALFIKLSLLPKVELLGELSLILTLSKLLL